MILLYLNTTNGEWFLEDGTSAGNGLPRIPYRNRETVGVQLVTATPGEDTEGVIPASDWPKDTQFSGAGGIAALLTTDNNYLRHLLGSLPQAVSAGSISSLTATIPGATLGTVPDAGFVRLFDPAGDYEELEYTAREIGENNAVTFTLAQGASLSSSYASGSPVDCGEGVYAQASLDSQNSDATKGYFQFDLYCYSKKLRLAVDYSDSREVEDVRGLELLVYSVSSLDGAVSIRSTWLCDGFSIPVPMALPPAAPEPSEEETENRIAPTVAAMLAYGFALQFSEDGETDWHSTQDATVDQYFRFRSKSGSGDWSDPILIPKGVDGEDGEDGKSAYQIWLDNGHTGTEAQFLASLKGDAGTSSYTYVAFASDANGSNFSLTQSSSLKYRAEIHTTTPIATPTASDFSGATWMKYLGDDGNGVDSATATTLAPGSAATASLVNKVLTLGIPRGDTGASFYLTIAYASDSTGAGFSLVPSNLLKYVAFLVTPSPLPAPSASDFVNATWVKYIGNDGDNAFTVDDAFSGTSENAVQNKVIKAKLDQVDAAIASNASAIDTKQSNLSFDSTPTNGSNNPVTSDGIFAALKLKQASLPAGVLDKFLKYGSNGLEWDTPAGGGGGSFDAIADESVVSQIDSIATIKNYYDNNLHGFQTGIRKVLVAATDNTSSTDLINGHIYALATFPETIDRYTEITRWYWWYSVVWEQTVLRHLTTDEEAEEQETSGWGRFGGDYHRDLEGGGWLLEGGAWRIISGVLPNDTQTQWLIIPGSLKHDQMAFVDIYMGIQVADPSDPSRIDGYISTSMPGEDRVDYVPKTFEHVIKRIYTLRGLTILLRDITPCVAGTCPFVDPTDSITSLQSRVAALEALAMGTLTVTHTGTAPDGAQWSVDSGTTWRDFGTSATLPPGTYTVTFKSVTGYTAPSSQSVTLTAGGTQSVSVAYTAVATTGTVTLTFSGTVPTGAGWTIDGQTYTSGQTATLSPGTYAITYASVTGYDSPSTPSSVTVAADDTLTLSAEYTEQQSSGPSYIVSGLNYADANGTYTLVDGLNGRNSSPVFSNGTWYLAYGYDSDDEEMGWALTTVTPSSSLSFAHRPHYWVVTANASAPPTSGWRGGVTVTAG